MKIDIDKDKLQAFIRRGLEEDLAARGDVTSKACIPEDQVSYGKFLIKDSGILSGISIAELIFKTIDPEIKFETLIEDGQAVSYGDICATVEGNSRNILKGERLALNTMQRLSGISTLSRKYAAAVTDLDVKILDTRKTTPGIRFLEKWAVAIGGCYNYRDGLYDWVMIKDNHVNASGGITAAVHNALAYLKEHNLELDITVEVQSIDEVKELMKLDGIRRVMLDNFELVLLREAIALVDGKYETEASGGVNLNTVRDIALTGVDYISVGALTHSAPNFDISLNFVD